MKPCPTAGRLVLLANPRGFCAGVRRAVELAEAVLRKTGAPAYALGEIVHNPQVVGQLAARGLRVVHSLDNVPDGQTVLFSAHGVAPAVRAAAAARGLHVVDASCPFVKKVHAEVRRFVQAGCAVALIGRRAHDEVAGVVGEAPGRVTVLETPEEAAAFRPPDPAQVGVVTQTTLSDADIQPILAVLRARFPHLRTPHKKDVCYATTNRQRAVRELAARAPLVLVLGAANSSNSLRLVEVAKGAGTQAFLIGRIEELDQVLPLRDAVVVGLTAGASTPDDFIAAALDALRVRGFNTVRELEAEPETLRFDLAAEWRE